MSKLYVFGIGGTGSRVLKSLTMLLASGVKCGADTIVPIIIDPDISAADKERSVSTIKRYNTIRENLNFDDASHNAFFATKIEEYVHNFQLPLSNTNDKQFKDYIGLSTMGTENNAFMNMLFSQNNLDSDMQVGFKGNPNIGSVVLNQFADSTKFKNFANEFTQNDKIFIISSIFGGTGASGFPLLAKLLRSNTSIPNFNIINNAPIGAITVMPYFSVEQDDKSAIDSCTFISKTKAALSYYMNNISNNNTLDALYYIADSVHNTYKNNEGGHAQKNDAHVIEFLSALAVLDFSHSNFDPNAPRQTIHKEYGLNKDNDQNELIFENLGKASRSDIQKPFTQFMLFCNYFRKVTIDYYIKQKWAEDAKLDKSFFESQFMKNVFAFQTDFVEWLSEMSKNNRKFTPFELNEIDKTFDIVKGVKPCRVNSIKSNYDLFDDQLNHYKEENKNKEQHIFELFYNSTNSLITKKFNF